MDAESRDHEEERHAQVAAVDHRVERAEPRHAHRHVAAPAEVDGVMADDRERGHAAKEIDGLETGRGGARGGGALGHDRGFWPAAAVEASAGEAGRSAMHVILNLWPARADRAQRSAPSAISLESGRTHS